MVRDDQTRKALTPLMIFLPGAPVKGQGSAQTRSSSKMIGFKVRRVGTLEDPGQLPNAAILSTFETFGESGDPQTKGRSGEPPSHLSLIRHKEPSAWALLPRLHDLPPRIQYIRLG
ncbi:hypothetical protein POX_g09261 [Penicillium oxalicum]|uniref:Uncharacterized protein n=1 Tax=Penicillium oxalicum (strain 114-2 / CGMCC 5302) TaxID=933388 RepID=S7Z7B0_PENO1|nr:hypothetical protein POX_g09261 [Penicillium oxalicum]EPS26440.1 hypothetical protein PDE_01377 [Penicillium oxalicum 114-2]KAI2786865.1 hypothetical protein POX_g09261 [Penicillium oxalicum]